MTKQELIQAAKEIKRNCMRNRDCDCPFADSEGICVLRGYSPMGWNISVLNDLEAEKCEKGNSSAYC